MSRAPEFEHTFAGITNIVNSANFQIGNGPCSYVYPAYFAGSLDEVAVWNKSLSLSDVQLIYNKQKSNYSGTLTSKIFDGLLTSANWESFNWKTSLPFGKNLTQANETRTNYSALVDSNGISNNSSLATGLVGLWHLDDAAGAVAKDSSSTGQDGGATNVTFNQNGKIGNGASFNGSSSVVMIPNEASLRNSTGTYSVWMKTAGAGVSYRGIIAMEYNAGLSLNDNILGIYDWGANTFRSTGLNPADNQWHLVTLTYSNGTPNGTRVYLDGDLVLTTTSSIANLGNPVTLGNNNTQNQYFSGLLDEAAVWNRELHANEIKMLYRRGINRVMFQVRSCSSPTCADDVSDTNWKGPNGTNSTYYSELNNLTPNLPNFIFDDFTSPQPAAQRYFQYRTFLESDSGSLIPDVQLVQMESANMDTTAPNVITKNGIDYYNLSSAVQTLGTNNCSAGIKYNLGKGTTHLNAVWYYWNGTNWVTAGGTEVTANTVAALNASSSAALVAFSSQFGEGKVFLKAFLKSDGTSPCELNSFQLDGLY